MSLAAVLDASVLYPLPLRDTLLRLAETELYDVYWSERILDEVTRNLVADGRATDEQARRLTDAMTAAFEGAAVPQDAIDHIEPDMTNEPEDRHVLAAAVAARVGAVITLNLKDFPADACEPLGIDAMHPDTLLLDLHALDPAEVGVALERQAAALRRPPLSLPDCSTASQSLCRGSRPPFANRGSPADCRASRSSDDWSPFRRASAAPQSGWGATGAGASGPRRAQRPGWVTVSRPYDLHHSFASLLLAEGRTIHYWPPGRTSSLDLGSAGAFSPARPDKPPRGASGLLPRRSTRAGDRP